MRRFIRCQKPLDRTNSSFGEAKIIAGQVQKPYHTFDDIKNWPPEGVNAVYLTVNFPETTSGTFLDRLMVVGEDLVQGATRPELGQVFQYRFVPKPSAIAGSDPEMPNLHAVIAMTKDIKIGDEKYEALMDDVARLYVKLASGQTAQLG